MGRGGKGSGGGVGRTRKNTHPVARQSCEQALSPHYDSPVTSTPQRLPYTLVFSRSFCPHSSSGFYVKVAVTAG